MKERFNGKLKAISLAGILAVASAGMVGCDAELSSELKIKKRDPRARYIMPGLQKDRSFILENGSQVRVFSVFSDEKLLYKNDDPFRIWVTGEPELIFSISSGEDRYKFRSFWPYDSFFQVFLWDGEEYQPFTRDNMDNFSAWNQRYNELLDDLYGIKSTFEENWGVAYDMKIRCSEPSPRTEFAQRD